MFPPWRRRRANQSIDTDRIVDAIEEASTSSTMQSRRNQLLALLAVTVGICVPVTIFVLDDEDIPEQPFDIIQVINPDELIDAAGQPVGGEYIVASPIDSVGPAPNGQNQCAGRFEWAQSLDAVQADVSLFRLSIENIRPDTARLLRLEPVVVASRPPLQGTHLSCPGRGGASEIQTVGITLESPPSLVTATATGVAIPFQFDLVAGEVEVFDITAFAPACDCDWHLVLHYESAGELGTLVIDNAGENFRTSSSANSTTYHFLDGDWVDIDNEPAEQQATEQADDPVEDAAAPTTVPPAAPCELLTVESASETVGETLTEAFTSKTSTFGASGVQMTDNRCTFTLNGQSGPPQTISVIVNEFQNPEDAQTEFEMQISLYTSGAPDTAVLETTDTGTTATLDFALLEVNGAIMLTAQVDPSVPNSQEIARRLISSING